MQNLRDFDQDQQLSLFSNEDITVLTVPVPPKAPKPEKSKKDAYTEGFEQFWSAYPRRIEKKYAYGVYLKVLNTKDDLWRKVTDDYLYRCAVHYAQECQEAQRTAQFIKHPSTFLSAGRRSFEEYHDGVREQAPAPLRGLAQRMQENHRSVDEAYRRLQGVKSDERVSHDFAM
nr:hypothetical protein [Bacilli bacterium]